MTYSKQEKLNRIYEVINFPYDDGDAVYTPVMIGDCLDWLENNLKKSIDCIGCHMSNEIRFILGVWKSKRLPIDSQNEDCVDYIYSLIK